MIVADIDSNCKYGGYNSSLGVAISLVICHYKVTTFINSYVNTNILIIEKKKKLIFSHALRLTKITADINNDRLTIGWMGRSPSAQGTFNLSLFTVQIKEKLPEPLLDSILIQDIASEMN